MYSATFTFAPGEYDDEFHRLDQTIAEIARSIAGYLGEEAWESPSSGLISTVYYWQTLQALQQLMDDPRHIEAKRRQAQWINGYHVVIAQVIRSHGDGGIAHPLAHIPGPRPGRGDFDGQDFSRSTIHIRPLQAHEWPVYRDLRLHALQEAPDAFGSSLEAEAVRSDAAWQARIASALAGGMDHVLVAFHGDHACGLLWCKLSATEPGMADLYQMWMAPAARGLGAGRALLQAALDWARAAGARRVRLGVTVADSPAMRLYHAAGFHAVGDPQPLRDGSALLAQAMERSVEGG